jgi:hypothetical protein
VLDTVPGLRAERCWPDAINPPVAFPMPLSEDYLVTMSDATNVKMRIVVLAGALGPGGYVRAQQLLDNWLDERSVNSIKKALEADPTLGGVVDDVIVQGWDNYHGRWEHGNVLYWGASFLIEVYR